MPSCCLVHGLCFIHPILKGHIQGNLQSLDPTSQLELLDKLKLGQQVLSQYIQSEVLNRLNPTTMTNEHLLQINQRADEELFFESWPQEGQ